MSERWTLGKLPEYPAPATEQLGLIRVLGLIGRPRTLTPLDLARMPQKTLTDDFICDDGWTVPHQTWSGVLVSDILDDVVDEDGLWVEFASGSYAFSSPLEDAVKGIIALTLNGESLPAVHGGPCRLYLPGEACYTSIKWLDRIEVRRNPGPNHAAEIARQRLPKPRGAPTPQAVPAERQ
jgi:DMSO/TMAO reductase YedYZ molybdopterin-dependent catalytic subunit